MKSNMRWVVAGSIAIAIAVVMVRSVNAQVVIPQPSSRMLNVSYNTGSEAASATAPSVLIRWADILSKSETGNLSIRIFDHVYTVNTSNARILDINWAPVSLSKFSVGAAVNVWGTLDLEDPTLIHALTIRNPLPTFLTEGALSPTALHASSTASAVSSTADIQAKLNILEAAIKALQLQLGQ